MRAKSCSVLIFTSIHFLLTFSIKQLVQSAYENTSLSRNTKRNLETHLLVIDFKALSIRVTSVTDKDTINAYIIDQEVYSAWISFFVFVVVFFSFSYLPSFIGLRRGAGPALEEDGKVDAEPERYNF